MKRYSAQPKSGGEARDIEKNPHSGDVKQCFILGEGLCVSVPLDNVEISIESNHAERHNGGDEGQKGEKLERHAGSMLEHPTLFDNCHHSNWHAK